MSIIEEIAAERTRQIEVEGWTPDHDDSHPGGQIGQAAACYAASESVSFTDNYGRALLPDGTPRPFTRLELRQSWSYSPALRWPWDYRWFKIKGRRSNLIRAAALLVAEIERIDRLEQLAPSVDTKANTCPKCGEEFRLAWIGNDPPEPYGDLCGCPDPEFADARDEKRANDRDAAPVSA